MTDAELIELYFNRDENALVVTKDKYGRLLKQVISGICGRDEDVEECENDTYLSLWNAIPPERPLSFMAYACRIARNRGLKLVAYANRAKRKSTMDECYEELDGIITSSKGDPQEALEAGELQSIISDFLRERDKIDRVIFVKRYWLYQDVEAIAEEVGISAGRVYASIRKTKKLLADRLIKEGYLVGGGR